jgi:hypothetical protein
MCAIRYIRTRKRQRAADLLILSMKQSQFDIVKVTYYLLFFLQTYVLFVVFPSFGS